MVAEEIVKVGKRGQITIPLPIRNAEQLREGDFLEVSDVGGILALRKVEKKPTVLDLFAEVGAALRKQGVTTKERALELAERIKQGRA